MFHGYRRKQQKHVYSAFLLPSCRDNAPNPRNALSGVLFLTAGGRNKTFSVPLLRSPKKRTPDRRLSNAILLLPIMPIAIVKRALRFCATTFLKTNVGFQIETIKQSLLGRNGKIGQN